MGASQLYGFHEGLCRVDQWRAALLLHPSNESRAEHSSSYEFLLRGEFEEASIRDRAHSRADESDPRCPGRRRKSAAPETFCAFRFISGTTTRSPGVRQIRANGGSNDPRNVGRSGV